MALVTITDGTSNVLLAGEKRLNLAFLGQDAPDDNEGYTCGWDWDEMRSCTTAPAPDFRDPTNNGGGGGVFGSSHTGLFNAIVADGSIRSIRYSVTLAEFTKFGRAQDGANGVLD